MQDLESLLALEAAEVKFEEVTDDYYHPEVRRMSFLLLLHYSSFKHSDFGEYKGKWLSLTEA